MRIYRGSFISVIKKFWILIKTGSTNKLCNQLRFIFIVFDRLLRKTCFEKKKKKNKIDLKVVPMKDVEIRVFGNEEIGEENSRRIINIASLSMKLREFVPSAKFSRVILADAAGGSRIRPGSQRSRLPTGRTQRYSHGLTLVTSIFSFQIISSFLKIF